MSKVNSFAIKYLEWDPQSDKPATYKQLSDNLRAYLTIGAYIIVLHYLWNFGPYRIPAWVYKGTAILWGLWIFWFAVLTVMHTFYLYMNTAAELIVFLTKPFISQKVKEEGLTETHNAILTLFFLPFVFAGFALVSGVFYLGLAWLRYNKLF